MKIINRIQKNYFSSESPQIFLKKNSRKKFLEKFFYARKSTHFHKIFRKIRTPLAFGAIWIAPISRPYIFTVGSF